MRLTILSRASDLAQVQAMAVESRIKAAVPAVRIERHARASLGDRQPDATLTAFGDKGAFTADLSEALAHREADIVVHSWKDLPVEERDATVVAGTLERADPRDVLLLGPGVAERRPAGLTVLSSSPRRMWLLAESLPGLLPWRVHEVKARAVRGNVPTRLRKLVAGEGHGLLVAKAALDRLLTAPPMFARVRDAVREAVDACTWMVLPLRSWPTAPAQGALAIEIARGRSDLAALIRDISHEPTEAAVGLERTMLAGYGGGCHAPIAVTAVPRAFGRVVSVRARTADGDDIGWRLERQQPAPVPARLAAIWPRPDESRTIVRRPIAQAPAVPADAGLWVARADALPPAWPEGRPVWAAGERTWRKLAARGVWVHGCADGLGDDEAPGIDALAGRTIPWRRLTHREAALGDPAAVATYEIARTLPEDLNGRTHFFWTSGCEFREALQRFPAIRDRWHGSGPGRTHRTIEATLGRSDRTGIWLDYESWLTEVTRT